MKSLVDALQKEKVKNRDRGGNNESFIAGTPIKKQKRKNISNTKSKTARHKVSTTSGTHGKERMLKLIGANV